MDANEEEKMIRDKGWGECEREALWMFIIIYDMITRRLFWNNNSTTTSDVVVWVVFKKDRKPRESFVCGRRPHSFLFFFFFFYSFILKKFLDLHRRSLHSEWFGKHVHLRDVPRFFIQSLIKLTSIHCQQAIPIDTGCRKGNIKVLEITKLKKKKNIYI